MNIKIDAGIQQKLFSAKTETVISALHTIRDKGNKAYIPLLFDLLSTQPEKEIEQGVLTLLSTVKDKETVNIFMRALENEKYRPIRKIILTACWQNGLDFSTFLPIFIDIIIAEDWEIAFEAFTIVDNFEMLPTPAIIETSVSKINLVMDKANEQKRYFLNEILSKITA